MGIFIAIAFILIIYVLSLMLPIALVIISFLALFKAALYCYEHFYYRSENFIGLKNAIRDNTTKCNELNQHIEHLKRTYTDIKSIDYGEAIYTDQSRFNYRRPELKHLQQNVNVFECSQSVCKNAQAQPFKYFLKYFNVKPDEETLAKFENVLNNFSAAEEGKLLLKREREQILESISGKIPFLYQFSF